MDVQKIGKLIGMKKCFILKALKVLQTFFNIFLFFTAIIIADFRYCIIVFIADKSNQVFRYARTSVLYLSF